MHADFWMKKSIKILIWVFLTWFASGRFVDTVHLVRPILAVVGSVTLLVVVETLLSVVAREAATGTVEGIHLAVELVVSTRTVCSVVAPLRHRDTLSRRAPVLAHLAVHRHLTSQPVRLQHHPERASTYLCCNISIFIFSDIWLLIFDTYLIYSN